MRKRMSRSGLPVLALVAALLMLSVAPALADPDKDESGKGKQSSEQSKGKSDEGQGKSDEGQGEASKGSGKDNDGDAGNTQGQTTEDTDEDDSPEASGTPNNQPDDDDNEHPSGKDRSVEHDKGNQGNAQSEPDDDSRGPDGSNGGWDKPGGHGGVDRADQDGNNGCGNDDDFEDDNEGQCGGNRQKGGQPPGGQGGNLGCPAGVASFKIEGNVGNGTYSDGTLAITISNATGTSFSWVSNLQVDAVLVKGGPATQINPGGTSGTASAPFNPNSGQLYGISHVTFCYTPVGGVIIEPGPVPPCDANPNMPGTQPCEEDKGPKPCDANPNMPGTQPCDVDLDEDDGQPVPPTIVLGTPPVPPPLVVQPARRATPPAVAGGALPFTGAGSIAFWLVSALGLLVSGLTILRVRQS